MSPALNALRLLLTVAAARAYYMPPAFDAEAVPGYNSSSSNSAARNASTFESQGSQSETAPATAVFNFRNRTAWYADSVQPAEARATDSAVQASGQGSSSGAADNKIGRPTPVWLSQRDVWSPPITAPDEGTVWTVGSVVTVRWDASDPPKDVTNPEGTLVLGHYEGGDETDEHLDDEHPLAKGFDLSQGQVQVKVPSVNPSDHYIVVLFGDSGNRSPQFKIAG